MDRNGRIMSVSNGLKPSLSARRAWIEIRLADMSDAWHRVALRKESVDRNRLVVGCLLMLGVALRKESVDRNSCWLLA